MNFLILHWTLINFVLPNPSPGFELVFKGGNDAHLVFGLVQNTLNQF